MKGLSLMLRASCLAATAFCAAVGVADEVVYTGQDTGTIAVNGTGKSTIVAVAFNELGATNANVSAANIVSTKNLAAGDQLFIYKDGGYEAWNLVEQGSDASAYLVWQPVAKKFTVGADGQLNNENGADATAVTAPVGSGFWLIRQPNTGRNLNLPFYIFGACATPSATNAAHGAMSLMGNPCMTNAAPAVANAVEGDSIQLKTEMGVLNPFYYIKAPNDPTLKWRGTGENDQGEPYCYAGENPPTIPAGAGFWYVSKGAEDVTFTWPNN